MPGGWAGLIARRGVAATVACSAVVLTAVFGRLALDLQHDDDVFAFLPREDPDVRAFHEINARFGGLEVALVGVGTRDVFDPTFFAKLQKTTRQLIESQEVEHALSLANVEDFKPSADGGIETGLLVPGIPADPAERAALVSRALHMEMVAGQLVDAEGRAAAIVCLPSHGTEARAFAAKVKEIVEANLSGEELHFGGAPFVSTYIYGATQDDLRRLTPWAVVVIVLIVVAAFRDVAGAAIALLTTGMGIVITIGVMSLVGARFNIVLSSMPVILFAVGSAYAIHVLVGYRARASRASREEAVTAALRAVAPMVLASALATCAGLLSFLVMDIAPLRTFGIYTALGVAITVLLSLTFVPAALVLLPVRAARQHGGGFAALWARIAAGVVRRRAVVALALLASAALAAPLVTRVSSTMDETAFFSPGSPPDLARGFLGEHFGFSQFLQIDLAGDFGDPHALRALERLGDAIALLPGVTAVQHVAQVIAKTNESMEGARRVPDDAAKVTLLYGFLSAQPTVRALVTSDRRHALLHVKLRAPSAAELEGVIAAVERSVSTELAPAWRVAPSDDAEGRERVGTEIALRIAAAAKLHGASIPRDAGALAAAVRSAAGVAAPASEVEEAVRAFLGSGESPVPAGEKAGPLAAALAALGPSPDPDRVLAAVKEALAGDESSEDLALALGTPIEEAWRAARAKARAASVIAAAGVKLPPDAERAAAFTTSAGHAVSYLDAPTVAVPLAAGAAPVLTARVSGLPVMHRGLSRSVASNQVRSVVVALLLVVPILAFAFRSLWAGLLCAAPTLLTLTWIFAGMGLLGIHLDVGTSMLGSLIIGAGVDYAMHYLDAWRGDALADAAASGAAATAPGAWTNALMVAAGFFVLTLGEARPLRSFGGLTAAAMIAAALATYLAIPALARRLAYGRRREWTVAAEEEDSPLVEDRT